MINSPEIEAWRHLIDCMVMFENIERNRNMPPDAYTQRQYVAKGRELRQYLEQVGAIRRQVAPDA